MSPERARDSKLGVIIDGLCQDTESYPESIEFVLLQVNYNNIHAPLMGGLVISRADCRAISARRRTTAHFTVLSTVLCTGYV
jgi:hypothetical protein